AEMLLNNDGFQAVDLKQRVFSKPPRAVPRDRIWGVPRNADGGPGALLNHVRLRDAAFDSGPVPQLILDAEGHLVLANRSARTLFSLGPTDLGHPFKDLELSYRPVELRSGIDRAHAERKPVTMKDVEWTT